MDDSSHVPHREIRSAKRYYLFLNLRVFEQVRTFTANFYIHYEDSVAHHSSALDSSELEYVGRRFSAYGICAAVCWLMLAEFAVR